MQFVLNKPTTSARPCEQQVDPGRTRTCNLWFRRPTPYPLGHRADGMSGAATGLSVRAGCTGACLLGQWALTAPGIEPALTKGLRDRNSPTCTLSQNGYGDLQCEGPGSWAYVLLRAAASSALQKVGPLIRTHAAGPARPSRPRPRPPAPTPAAPRFAPFFRGGGWWAVKAPPPSPMGSGCAGSIPGRCRLLSRGDGRGHCTATNGPTRA